MLRLLVSRSKWSSPKSLRQFSQQSRREQLRIHVSARSDSRVADQVRRLAYCESALLVAVMQRCPHAFAEDDEKGVEYVGEASACARSTDAECRRVSCRCMRCSRGIEQSPGRGHRLVTCFVAEKNSGPPSRRLCFVIDELRSISAKRFEHSGLGEERTCRALGDRRYSHRDRPRAYRREKCAWLARGDDDSRICRRLFEQLQERIGRLISSFLRYHSLGVPYDEDFSVRHCWRDCGLLNDSPHRCDEDAFAA